MANEIGIKFNIYYLNITKVYEISMLIENIIATSIQRENSKSKENSWSRKSSISTGMDSKQYLASLKGGIDYSAGEKNNISSKMIESLEVKTTKSILLGKIIPNCHTINTFSDNEEGDLIKIDKVKLKHADEERQRQISILKKEAFKGMRVEGLDINNLIGSMLHDYSYILEGNVQDMAEKIMLKIPSEMNAEFESKYSIDDILIGNVSLIGIYKGVVDRENISKNNFQYLIELGEHQKKSEGKIIPSIEEDKVQSFERRARNRNEKYHFIDILAIIQEVNFKKEEHVQEIKIPWYKRVILLLKRKEHKNG
nr:hypothetical protein [uncultured Niameybacter sp.]